MVRVVRYYIYIYIHTHTYIYIYISASGLKLVALGPASPAEVPGQCSGLVLAARCAENRANPAAATISDASNGELGA